MKHFARVLTLAGSIFLLGSAFAGTEEQLITQAKSEEKVPIDIFETETGYVFESDLNHGGSFGKQYEFQNEFVYGHRFLLNGN